MLTLPPLSLYVHIPWCVRKCPYCDFNSHEVRGEIPEALYIRALKEELGLSHPQAQGRKLASIFIGGGTPSLFSARAIGDLLEYAEAMIGFTDEIEITLEANPGATELQRFRDYRSAGVNRLSIGVQSFLNTHLQRLGRIHDRAAAIAAADAAHGSGFDNFNLDLMYGLPTQTVAQALDDLELASRLEPTHLSWYQLTIEPNTLFYKEPPPLPQEGVLEEIQEAGEEFLQSQHFVRYEVSAFARAQHQSRHNTNYWQFGDYLGIGAGAHGKITDLVANAIYRSRQPRLPKDYLAQASTDRWGHRQQVAKEELPVEFFMNALRLVEGVEKNLYNQHTGLEFAQIEQKWQRLVDLGLLAPADQMLASTPTGFRFLDDVLQSLC